MKFSPISFLFIICCLGVLSLGILDVIGVFKFTHYFEFLNISKYLDFPAIFIIFGGLFANAFIISSPGTVKEVVKMFGKVASQSKITEKSLLKDINAMMIWVEEYRRNRVDFINKIQQESKDDFVKYIFTLMSTNYSVGDLNDIVETQIRYRASESKKLADLLKNMGSSGPAFGMFGTLFGLVYMLSSLDNPSAIGPGLALGLLATLYGVSSAHLIFFPLGKKVVFLSEIQRKRDEMILECASMIIAEKSALYIKDKLLSNLNLRYINNPYIPDETEEEVAIADAEETEADLMDNNADEKESI